MTKVEMECYICGHDHERVLQKHHLIPRRFDGTNTDENLVTLCANCHLVIEQLYDDKFFRRLLKKFDPKERDMAPKERMEYCRDVRENYPQKDGEPLMLEDL